LIPRRSSARCSTGAKPFVRSQIVAGVETVAERDHQLAFATGVARVVTSAALAFTFDSACRFDVGSPEQDASWTSASNTP
jgi:hypothetical protein